MKYIIWILSILNIYIGMRCFLNVINVLQDSKYSQGATVVFAILFLSMGIGGLYFAWKENYKLALLIELGPWVLGLLFLFVNMLIGDYK
jgi:hypothetical protein